MSQRFTRLAMLMAGIFPTVASTAQAIKQSGASVD